MKKKRKGQPYRITAKDILNTIKKTDRETELSFRPGWAAKVKIHASKKAYNRKDFKIPEE